MTKIELLLCSAGLVTVLLLEVIRSRHGWISNSHLVFHFGSLILLVAFMLFLVARLCYSLFGLAERKFFCFSAQFKSQELQSP